MRPKWRREALTHLPGGALWACAGSALNCRAQEGGAVTGSPFLSAQPQDMSLAHLWQSPQGPPKSDVLSPELNSSRERRPLCSTSTQSKIICGCSSLARKLNLASWKEGMSWVAIPAARGPESPSQKGRCLSSAPLPTPQFQSSPNTDPGPAPRLQHHPRQQEQAPNLAPFSLRNPTASLLSPSPSGPQ